MPVQVVAPGGLVEGDAGGGYAPGEAVDLGA